MKRLIRFTLPFALGAILVALAAWWLLEHREDPADGLNQAAAPKASQIWTCSMHPQIRMDHPDICPLCGMDLTPVDANQDPWEAVSPGTRLALSEQARRMARVATAEVLPREIVKELRTVGRVELDETRVAYLTARIDGRVEQVYADFPGTMVRQGEHLVKIYSPDLVTTQQEFLTAMKSARTTGRNPQFDLSASSRRRLLLWGITEQQIDELARSGQAQDHLTVYAPMGGTVIEKNVRAGQYVKEGDALYTIADLSHVWLVLEVYESELAWVRVGQAVEVKLESEPQRPLSGKVAFIEPVLTNTSRTVRVRVIVANREARLKPGMYAQTHIHIPLLPDGQPVPTGLEGKYICPMHPYEVSDKPGTCSYCKMPLELVPGKPAAPGGVQATLTAAANDAGQSGAKPQVLAVPAEAVLTTGQRQLVYVEREPGKYELVEPKLGPRAGDYYPVLGGLNAGDRVVTRGNFLLDSQYQITGRTSLLYPGGSTGEAEATTGFTAKEQANIDKLAAEDRELAMKQEVCPITDKKLGSMGVPVKMEVEGRTIFLCCKGCVAAVKADPAGTLKEVDAAGKGDAPAGEPGTPFTAEELAAIDELPEAERAMARQQKVCPATGFNLGSMGMPFKMEVNGRTLFLCCEGCAEAVKADPEGALKKVEPHTAKEATAPPAPPPAAGQVHGGSHG